MSPGTASPANIRFTATALAGRRAAIVIPFSALPAPANELAPVREFLSRLVAGLVERHRGALDTFVQLTQLHVGDGSRLVAANGREWRPSMGLGVWPHRDPPHGWTKEELSS